MKLIVGLGNPGDRYHFTRHNFGFLALDFLATRQGFKFENKPKFHGDIIYLDRANDKIYLKPSTFYNEVGQSIRAVADFYKIPKSDILVVCDDFCLNFGKLRFREKGSAGGNNGLKSAIQHLGGEDFPRLRLGTANNELRARIGDVDFVLSKFTEAERAQLPQVLAEIEDFIVKY